MKSEHFKLHQNELEGLKLQHLSLMKQVNQIPSIRSHWWDALHSQEGSQYNHDDGDFWTH